MKITVRIGDVICEHELSDLEFKALTSAQLRERVSDMAGVLLLDKMEAEFSYLMRRLTDEEGRS